MRCWLDGSFRPGRILSLGAALLLVTMLALSIFTIRDIQPVPDALLANKFVRKSQVLDRLGRPLSRTYQNEFNLTALTSLSSIPLFLQQAFIQAEDKRFMQHAGVDWVARLSALKQNLFAFQIKRGASTISEQVVKMLHPRPRSLWARWLEGWEAYRLESKFSKAEILEFYLNQVPYARNMRGVSQAASYYFDRDLSTLSHKEMLLLAVLVRSPGRFDRNLHSPRLHSIIESLGERMQSADLMTGEELKRISSESLVFKHSHLDYHADHFVQWVLSQSKNQPARETLLSTLDAELQTLAQSLLDRRVADLRDKKVSDGALLLADHHTGQILAWVNAGRFDSQEPGSQIDAILATRQPGSTLKPFLYALALDSGWTAASIIDDSPITHAVGRGLHLYRNYSRVTYGPVRLRQALGNSLNIPAIRTVMHTGKDQFLEHLHRFGFKSLTLHPDFYGEGLALGNGEVTLLELVEAYAALANGGVYRPLIFQANQKSASKRVISFELASLIGDILSDPQAHTLEFGESDLLKFPTETAIKTGTSSDYNDAWALGYSSRYVAGVWLGNLNRRPMNEVSGAIGPVLVLRALFAELEKRVETRALPRSRELVQKTVCAETGLLAAESCPVLAELFIPGTEPKERCSHAAKSEVKSGTEEPKIILPTPGLNIALDPRIPDEHEAFAFRLDPLHAHDSVEWFLNGESIGKSTGDFYWKPERGRHQLVARLEHTDTDYVETDPVNFVVK